MRALVSNMTPHRRTQERDPASSWTPYLSESLKLEPVDGSRKREDDKINSMESKSLQIMAQAHFLRRLWRSSGDHNVD